MTRFGVVIGKIYTVIRTMMYSTIQHSFANKMVVNTLNLGTKMCDTIKHI